jgi:energy-coupling factor transporter ATP-binding protein EcfA2
MRLRKVRVEGFQSFADSGEIELSDGFNLIIGQNNSGKSALLRAMLPSLPDDRHRTPARWEDFKLAQPKVSFTIEASGIEIHDWSLRSGNAQFFPVNEGEYSDVITLMREIFQSGNVVVNVSRTPSSSFLAEYPSHNRFQYYQGNRRLCAMLIPSNGELTIKQDAGNANDTLPNLFLEAWNNDMFYFMAERMTIGQAVSGHAKRLTPNASNLPNVLHTLNSERGNVFKKLIGHMCEIFPTVGNLSVRSRPDNNNFEISVWPTDAMERVELSFPLNSSGTGVAQVIAILTAIMTVENAVIIIDEVNSFLHPAAVKALLRILQTEYSQHQYVISTHAPEVIGFSNPKTIHLVKRDGYESSVQRLDLTEVSEFREVAEHLGVSMADVFAADRVIWVEGPTEEICFPYLYQEFSGTLLPRGTIVTSVAATGDFNRKRDREIVYEVYRRLSSAAATLVVSTAFSFDTEELSDDEKAGMAKESGGDLSFLPRRHIECYLINPTAIANMIVAKDPSSFGVVSAETVAAKLTELASGEKFLISEWGGNFEASDWLAKVNAAKLIERATAELSEQRATFNKKEDSLALLKDILTRDRERLRPLYDYIEGLVAHVTG